MYQTAFEILNNEPDKIVKMLLGMLLFVPGMVIAQCGHYEVTGKIGTLIPKRN
jgi:hypothetical protein